MIRNLKVLGLALVAVLAMSAMMASAASAAPHNGKTAFTSDKETTHISATDIVNHKFKVTNSEVFCQSVSFTGHATGKTIAQVTINPVYTECFAEFIGIKVNATVTGFGHQGEANKCDYLVRANGTVDLVCAPGVEVTIHQGTCVTHIPPQTNLGTITYTDVGNHLNAAINITGITTNHTDPFGCPLTSGGHGTEGTLSGSSTVSGRDQFGAVANLGIH